MDADLKKLKKLTQLMKKEGLLELKLPNFELKLAPSAIEDKPAPAQEAETQTPQESLTPEQVLFWSSPLMAQIDSAKEPN